MSKRLNIATRITVAILITWAIAKTTGTYGQNTDGNEVEKSTICEIDSRGLCPESLQICTAWKLNMTMRRMTINPRLSKPRLILSEQSSTMLFSARKERQCVLELMFIHNNELCFSSLDGAMAFVMSFNYQQEHRAWQLMFQLKFNLMKDANLTPFTQGKMSVNETGESQNEGGILHKFWSPKKYDPKSGELLAVEIGFNNYYVFLAEIGIRAIEMDNGKRMLVKLVNNMVEIITIDQVVEQIKTYLKQIVESGLIKMMEIEMVMEEYFTRVKALHDKSRLPAIHLLEGQFLGDDAKNAYFCFKNCVVRVSDKGLDVLNYKEIQGKLVWKSQIIQREFHLRESDICEKSLFAQFARNVSGDDLNYESLQTIIGYLLHNYAGENNSKAVILQDRFMGINPNGGTGKGIIVKAIEKLRNVTNIDGKQFKPDRFPFSQVSIDTQVVVIDDIQAKFDFTFLFSSITEGLAVEKKGKDIFRFVPRERSPKTILTSNNPLEGNGSSHVRRKHEFSLVDYYNDNFTPEDEFGKLLFSDFTFSEWNEFDSYLLFCVAKYLQLGVIQGNSGQQAKVFTEIPSREFVDFMASHVELKPMARINISYLRLKFEPKHQVLIKEHIKKGKKSWAQTFRKWVVKYIELHGYYVDYNSKRQTLACYKLANLKVVKAYAETRDTVELTNQRFREDTGYYCTDGEFEKYVNVFESNPAA